MNEYLIASLERQWKEDPRSRIFLRLAEEYRKSGEYEKAVEVCRQGVDVHPTYVPALVCLGRCMLELGQVFEAEQRFNQVLKITPDNPHALRGLGNIFFDAGRDAEALPFFEALLIHEPMDEAVQQKVAEIKARLSQDVEEEAPTPQASEPELATTVDLDETLSGVPAEPSAPEGEPPPEEPVAGPSPDTDDETAESFAVFEKSDRALDELDIEFVDEGGLEPEEEPPAPSAPVLAAEDEKRLTTGLKHEKMGHYEEARALYLELGRKYAGPGVSEHLARIDQLLSSETKRQKKARYLSNWLDKIKGVYHVS